MAFAPALSSINRGRQSALRNVVWKRRFAGGAAMRAAPSSFRDAVSKQTLTSPNSNRLRTEWDDGLFALELIKQSIFPGQGTDGSGGETNSKIAEGTVAGTKLALTQMYQLIEKRFNSYFDMANFESSVPQDMSLEQKKELYNFETNEYPPHLAIIPKQDNVTMQKIFDRSRLADTGIVLAQIIPGNLAGDIELFFHRNPEGNTMAGLQQRNEVLISESTDIYTEDNVGNRRQWYSDALFAQQQLTGVNPTTLTLASPNKTVSSATTSVDWIAEFTKAATQQSNDAMVKLITSAGADSLYVQDCSYFRDAVGSLPNADLTSDDGTRFNCASVSLFHLNPDGKLHPLAIVIDYKTDMANSVVIFNKRLHPSDPTNSEETDWPWRYAKMCAQVADWTRHELTVHLTNTHFVEEVVIVATQRALDPTHKIFKLLSPHWLKTLSVNAAARRVLVPYVVTDIIGFTSLQTSAFVRDAYARFDWTGRYVPNDLNSRGFPVDKLATDPKYHNYAYGKNMALMWQVLRTFVSTCIREEYKSDAQVAGEAAIKDWVREMQGTSSGNMKSFPDINTVDQLIDAVTMCIHIASPQHTAINYLQEFYQCFLPNKPPALFSPLPKSLNSLLAYTEQDILNALPLGGALARKWLLATLLPNLLSYRVAKEQNLPSYAKSLEDIAASKKDSKTDEEGVTQQAGADLYQALMDLNGVFQANSDALDDQQLPYHVMYPEVTAVSILL